jgi:hypothetical protein
MLIEGRKVQAFAPDLQRCEQSGKGRTTPSAGG